MVERADQLDRIYGALAHPTRRRMMELLTLESMRVTELAAPFDVSLEAASKHIRILEAAGLVSRSIHGRDHVLSLDPEPLLPASEWIETYLPVVLGRAPPRPGVVFERAHMTGSSQGDRGRVRIEMALPAPIEDVYAAWTQPKAMARWLAPTGYADVEADVRVGGRFRLVMIGDGISIEHTGEYLTVEPPRRLSFTWQSPYTGADPSVVSVTLTADGNTTHLLLLHERLPDDAAESHRGGWGAILQRLVEEVLTSSKQGPKEAR